VGRYQAKDVLERQVKALDLAREGKSYDDIAKEVGFHDRSGARKAVVRALESKVVEGADELRLLEAARLDAIMIEPYRRAVEGDHAAVHRYLRISDRRVRLLGLDWRSMRVLSPTKPRTIVQPPEAPE